MITKIIVVVLIATIYCWPINKPASVKMQRSENITCGSIKGVNESHIAIGICPSYGFSDHVLGNVTGDNA
ncbi:hypothetical protein FSF39_023440 [Escherichia coli]|nr:hypothetical protein [Escherichia coli]